MSSTNDDEWFVVKDLDEFINSTRALVFNNFGKQKTEDEIDLLAFNIDPNDLKEIDKILSFDESKNIVEPLLKKKRKKYILNESIYLEIITSLNDRMVSNILNGLVNRGLVETAYDAEANDFVFWMSDHNEKPETD